MIAQPHTLQLVIVYVLNLACFNSRIALTHIHPIQLYTLRAIMVSVINQTLVSYMFCLILNHFDCTLANEHAHF